MLRTLVYGSGAKTWNRALVPEAHKEAAGGWLGEQQPRAQRFTIHAPLRYRAMGGEWQEGTIVNISESGVLFRTNQEAPMTRDIEMQFSLPTSLTGEAAAQVACRGVITRAVSFAGSAEPTGLAARISKFRFERPGRPPAA